MDVFLARLAAFGVSLDDPRVLAAAASTAALGAALALGLLARRRARAAPELTRDWQRFRVSGRVVANPESERPVVFLTLHVSTASLPTGAHVKLRALDAAGREVVRSYTPTRFHSDECELMFRVYPGGAMTPLLERLRVGDSVEMMGPTGLERYAPEGAGSFARGSARVWRGIEHVGMISGGTGITPMLQVANHVLQDPLDATRLSLLSFTNTVPDIMLGETLRALAAGSRGALRLAFVATHAREDELAAHADVARGSMRSMGADELERLLGVPRGERTMICICGPDGFVKSARALLEGRFENVLVW